MTFVKETCIRGYQVYNAKREAEVGDELECRRERSNRVDRFAVAVVNTDTVAGHEPKKISWLLFVLSFILVQCLFKGGYYLKVHYWA